MLAELGAGASGRVYRARDETTHEVVAVKVLDRVSGSALRRFKREFRVLAGLRHMNLVRCQELIEHNGTWMFTMELVVGCPFLDFVRSGERVNYERLRDAALQLAEALCALHVAGLVHRDVKPSNVLVRDDGSVVLLDFGLASPSRESVGFAGTVAYMAPEVAHEVPAAPAADMYSFGAMLHEAMTGTPPFGCGLNALMQRARDDAPRPSATCSDVPADLDALCCALLDPKPHVRPTAHTVLAGLRGKPDSESAQPTLPSLAPTAFFGRLDALAALERARERAREGLFVFAIEGESGIGKTALVRRFIEQTSEPKPWVLFGRSRENEALPYNAVDGAIDDLSRQLMAVPHPQRGSLLPISLDALEELFPVVSGLARPSAHAPRLPSDPGLRRNLAFAQCRELLQRVCDQRAVVLVLDDLQWADAESLDLLGELLRAPEPPCLLLIATLRRGEETDEAVRGALKRWMRAGQSSSLSLAGLSPSDATALALELAGGTGVERAHRLAGETAGHPIFIETLVRAANGGSVAPSFESALRCIADRLSAPTRKLLMAVCIEGTALETSVAASVAGLDGPEASHAVSLLSRERLIRHCRMRAGTWVEPYHDRVRTTLTSLLGTSERRELDRALARTLSSRASPNHESVARHLAHAGDNSKAAEAALKAAERALAALAFDRASKLYEWALALDPSIDVDVRLALAHTLASAGHSRRAARAFAQATESLSGERLLDARARMAQHLIRAGELEEGLAVAREALSEWGFRLSTTRGLTIASITWLWLKRKLRGTHFTPRKASELSASELRRLDALYEIGSALGPVSELHAVEVSMQQLLAALDLGEPGRIGRALALDAVGLYFMGARKRFPVQMAEAKRLVDASGDPLMSAVRCTMEALVFGFYGQHREAQPLIAQALADVDRHTVGLGWFRNGVLMMRFMNAQRLGQEHVLVQEGPAAVQSSLRQDDPYLRAQGLTMVAPYYFLCLDDPHRAQESLDAGAELFKRDQLSAHDWYMLYAQARIDWYQRVPARFERFAERFAPLEAAGVMRLEHVLRESLLVRTAAYVGRAQTGQQGPREAAQLERAITKVARHGTGVKAVRALLCLHAGDESEGLTLLASHQAESASLGHAQQARAAAYVRGKLARGSEGAALVRGAEAEARAQGIVRPEAIFAADLPGFELFIPPTRRAEDA